MSRPRGHGEHEEHVDESWLIPYADLLTLLLALFIVLFASSTVDKEKYNAMAQALSVEFGGAGIFDGVTSADLSNSIQIPTPGDDIGDTDTEPEGDAEYQSLKQLQGELNDYFSDEGIDAQISMQIDERGLVVSLRDSVLFNSGSADINEQYMQVLVKTGEIINKLDNYVRVEGHTDNVPIHGGRFDSNWELSSVRATTVVKLFVSSSGISPDKLSAVGYGEYKPVASNDTAEDRAKNRRVDIIILNSKYNDLEKATDGSATTDTPAATSTP